MKKVIKHICNDNLTGSFTLEAAVIMPLLLMILFQFVLLAFAMHDTVSAKNISYRYLIDYSMSCPNNLNLHQTYNDERILGDNVSFYYQLNTNALQITSSCFTLPVTFSNYNNTDLLRNYLSAKKLKENL